MKQDISIKKKDETRGRPTLWQCKTKILGGAERTVVMLELRQQAPHSNR